MNILWCFLSVILIAFIFLLTYWKPEKTAIKGVLIIIFSVFLGLTLTKAFEKDTIQDIKYHLPKLKAENLLFDMENDSVHLKFNLRNEAFIPAKSIRYITVFEDNIYLSPEVQEELSYGSSIMLYGFVGFEDFSNKTHYSVSLYVVYDI